jgi:regulator of replication initiation timing
MVDRLTKIENKIDTLSKEIHEFKSELKTLLSDKINLSSSVKESFIAV